MTSNPRGGFGGQTGFPCNIYRGGTSRGLLMLARDIPYPREVIDGILRTIIGSPDLKQINGVGGGSSVTSKVMIVERSEAPQQDVQMRFAQVSVDSTTVDWGGNCGNMTAAVGPFAIEVGLVDAVEPTTAVRILSLNTGLRVAVHVPVRNGRVVTEGDYEIPGVPGMAARIDLEWFEPGGSLNGKLLPTGRALETATLRDGRRIDVSIVDAANPVVFCDGRALGLSGTESPRDIESHPGVLEALEDIRSIGAEILGIVASRSDATRVSPGLPKVALVAPAAAYKTAGGATLAKDTHDLQARLMSMQLPHRSYAVSGGICTAVAAAVEGTVVHACAAGSRAPDGRFRIAHPYGIMDLQVEMTERDGAPYVVAARVGRTARRIISGIAYVPASLIPFQHPSFAGSARVG